MNITKRFLWADIIRIVAIYLVVLAHSTTVPANLTYFDGSIAIVSAIAKTCIPLFVMLSGALLLGKQESYSTFFSKRLARIMLPWIGWTIVYILYQGYYLQIHDIASFVKIMIGTMESFWFSPLIFCLYLVTPALRIFVRNAKTFDILLVVLFWFLVISVMPFHHDSYTFPRSVDNGILRQLINFIGYYMIGFVIVEKVRQKNLFRLGIIATVMGATWYGIFMMPVFMKGENFNVFVEYIAPGNMLLSIGVFVLIYFSSGKINSNISKKIQGALAYMSAATLGVYYVHGMVGGFVQDLYVKTPVYVVNNIINATILFAFSLLIILLLLRIPILKKFAS